MHVLIGHARHRLPPPFELCCAVPTHPRLWGSYCIYSYIAICPLQSSQHTEMAEEKREETTAGREDTEADGEPDFSKKHPLEYRWTLWFDNPQQKQSTTKYGQTLRQVFTFDTVEDFWW